MDSFVKLNDSFILFLKQLNTYKLDKRQIQPEKKKIELNDSICIIQIYNQTRQFDYQIQIH